MFHFPHLPPPGLCVQPGVTAHHRCRVAPFGNPGISLLDGSPWLIAVIPRPSSARSAKASTVRRSHLTCATPRAGTSRDREFLASNVADADVPHRMPRAALYTSPRHSGTAQSSFACHQEPHTYLPRSIAREYPAALCCTEPAPWPAPQRDAVDASQSLFTCQGASPTEPLPHWRPLLGLQDPILGRCGVRCQQVVYRRD